MKQTDLLSKRTLMLMITIITLIMANLIVPSCEKPERIVKIASVDILDTDISYTSVTLKGEIVDLGSRKIEDHGIILSENPMPRVGNARVESLGPITSKGIFQVTVSNLTKNTLYYFRPFVTIEGQDIYADKINQFKTKDTEIPIVTAGSVNGITINSVTLNGEVTSDGGEQTTKRGLCWGTSANPTISSCIDTTVNGTGKGTFTGNVKELMPGSQYFIRTWATNSKGTSYNSTDIVFRTHDLPKVTTTAISGITNTVAVSGGNVTDEGGVSVAVRGVCWGTEPGPTVILPSKTSDGNGLGNYVSSITGLIAGTTYYVRAFATNIYGTSYGPEVSFTTITPPVVVTSAVTLIGNSSVTLNGTVNANNSPSAVTFEYGTTTAYGTSVSGTPGTVNGNAVNAVSANLISLTPGTLYHYRIRAGNAGGSTDGGDQTFTTLQAPEATTEDPTNISTTSATLNGKVSANNSSTSISFEFGSTASYGSTIAAIPGTVTGNTLTSVSASLTGLIEGNTYHYRVKALSSGGTTYGEDKIINVLAPSLATTNAATSIANSTATLNGTVNANNLQTTVTFEFGTTTGYGSSAPATPSPVTGNTSTAVTADLTGLTTGTLYHYRVKATSSAGTTYGSDNTFTTLQPPTSTTAAVTLIGNTTVTLNGTVNANNSSTIVTFEYGPTISYGTIVTAIESPVTGNTSTAVTANLSGLTPGTTYHYKVKAVSAGGTTDGSDLTFTTTQPPTVITGTAGALTTTTATLNGTVNANNLSSNVTFEYGTTTGYGSIAAATPGTVTGSTTTAVTASLTGLTPSTTYHFRVKAVSSGGMTIGNDGSFITSAAQTVTDIDGNVYNAVTIGTQVWMTENLKTTKYRDGTNIPNVTNNTAWSNLTTGAYAWYNNDAATFKNTYGALYNYYATIDNRNLCPAGWHVPSNDELTILTTFLGGESIASGKLKEIGTIHWTSPNTGATNETGFTALPGGNRGYDGTYALFGEWGYLWCSTEYSPEIAWYRVINNTSTNVGKSSYDKRNAFSIRCLQGEGQVLPAVTTTAVSSITSTSASSGGNITSDGGASVTFRGVCWNTSTGPTTANGKTTDGTGTGAFTSNITGLSPATTYYVRTYATNSVGTVYGNEISFITSAAQATITDYDGNVYNVVTIGTQEWMKENLKVTHFANGDAIPNITDNIAWGNQSVSAYCWYNNDQATYKAIYGAMYNYHASIDNRNLCPSGWHMPSDGEWTTLTNYLGGENVAGAKLKETGIAHWAAPNTGSTNETGFTALPGGYRYLDAFNDIGNSGWFWSTSEYFPPSLFAWYRIMNSSNSIVKNYEYKQVGFSVRCLKGELPLTETVATSAVASNTTTLNGKVNPNGASTTVTFEYGTTTSYGTEVTATQSPVSGSVPVNVSFGLTGLTPGTTYHFRLKAVNSGGTSYGADLTFTTLAPPIATTGSASATTSNSATLNGTVNANNLSSTVTFEYGLTTSYGSSVTALESPVSGSASTPVTANISGLSPSTTYHFRVKAESTGGSSLGNDGSFTTSVSGATVTDYEGNIYNTVIIGSQRWMTENLKTTKYSDGTSIPFVTDGTTWIALTTGAYCDYDNTPPFSTTYGKLYNFYSTIDNRNLCPTGWHVPTGDEWTTLTTNLGGEVIAGGKLKETGTTHWASPNLGASNESGYTALPGGARMDGGISLMIGFDGFWWSSTEYSTSNAWWRGLYYDYANMGSGNYGKQSGLSVRCLQGELSLTETNPANFVASSSATLNGKVNANGSSTTVVFQYGITTSYGIDAPAIQSPVSGSASTNVSADLSGLTPGTLYHFRVKAVNSGGTSYGRDMSFIALSIGDSYLGGKVAYILQSGDPGYIYGEMHGLIAAPTDQSTNVHWYNGTYLVTGATGTAIGTGSSNTTTIVFSQGGGTYAAKLCYDLVEGGYSDWYLPSTDELNKLYMSRTAIGGFAVNHYWSSSESTSDIAQYQGFNNGVQNISYKDNTMYVRAIRSF